MHKSQKNINYINSDIKYKITTLLKYVIQILSGLFFRQFGEIIIYILKFCLILNLQGCKCF